MKRKGKNKKTQIGEGKMIRESPLIEKIWETRMHSRDKKQLIPEQNNIITELQAGLSENLSLKKKKDRIGKLHMLTQKLSESKQNTTRLPYGASVIKVQPENGQTKKQRMKMIGRSHINQLLLGNQSPYSQQQNRYHQNDISIQNLDVSFENEESINPMSLPQRSRNANAVVNQSQILPSINPFQNQGLRNMPVHASHNSSLSINEKARKSRYQSNIRSQNRPELFKPDMRSLKSYASVLSHNLMNQHDKIDDSTISLCKQMLTAVNAPKTRQVSNGRIQLDEMRKSALKTPIKQVVEDAFDEKTEKAEMEKTFYSRYSNESPQERRKSFNKSYHASRRSLSFRNDSDCDENNNNSDDSVHKSYSRKVLATAKAGAGISKQTQLQNNLMGVSTYSIGKHNQKDEDSEDLELEIKQKKQKHKRNKTEIVDVTKILASAKKDIQKGMHTLQQLTGKPPPHIELSSPDEKFIAVELVENIPKCCRLAVRGLLPPLTVNIKYEKFFFEPLPKIQKFQEQHLIVYASFKHRRPDEAVHEFMWQGKPKELLFTITNPVFKQEEFLYLTFESNQSTTIGVKSKFKKPYVKKIRGPKIFGQSADIDHSQVEFSGKRQLQTQKKALIRENMGKAVYWNQVQQYNKAKNEVTYELRLEQAQMRTEQIEQQKRNELLQKMNKWECFRLEREKVLKKYCNLIKKGKITKQTIVLCVLNKIIQTLKKNIIAKNVLKTLRFKKVICMNRIIKAFKRAIVKGILPGSTQDSRQIQSIRRRITANMNARFDAHLSRAASTIHRFLLEALETYKFVDAGNKFIGTIFHLQGKMTMTLYFNGAKKRYLNKVWATEFEEYIYQIENSSNNNDKFMYQKYKQNYNKDLIEPLLKFYLERCKYKYVLAFLQIRGVIKTTNNKELTEIFRSRQDYLCRIIAKAKELLDQDIQEKEQVKKKVTYRMGEAMPLKRNAILEVTAAASMDLKNTINDYHLLGMADPMGDMTEEFDKAHDTVNDFSFFKDVYPHEAIGQVKEDIILLEEHVGAVRYEMPKIIFKPSKELVRKMIMASIKYSEDDENTFILRFGLLAHPEKHLRELK